MDVPNPAPTTTAAVLDPRWLAATVYCDHPGIGITAVEVVETLVTTATKLRIVVSVADAPAGLCTRLCIKGMLDEVGSAHVGSGISKTEAQFYRDVAPTFANTPLMIPRCLYAGVDPGTGHGLIVMEDLVAAGGTFLTALNPYGIDEAADSLTQLARLHAGSWETRTAFPEWLSRTIDAMAAKSLIPLDLLQTLMDGPRTAPLSPALRDAGRLHRALATAARHFAGEPSCLIHGDAHAGNLYTFEGHVGLIDWQLAQRGSWAQDVAYHLAAALSPEDRRRHEAELLDHYLATLAAFGGPAIVRDDAWHSYRLGMLYGYYLWSITRRVDPVVTNEFVRRLGLAVIDLESLRAAET